MPTSSGALPALREKARRDVTVWIFVLGTLAWVPGGFSRFVFAKLLATSIACLIGASLMPTGQLPRRLCYLATAGGCAFLAAALLGDTPVASLVGRWPRYEGCAVLALYFASAWLGARTLGPAGRGLGALPSSLALMSVTLFAFTAAESLGFRPLGESNLTRTGSLLGNATDQGMVAMMAVLVLVPSALQSASRLRESGSALLLIGTCSAALTVVLSGSRASLLALVMALLGVSLVRRRDLAQPVIGMVVALVLLAIAIPQMRERLLSGQTVFGRGLQWQLTLDLIADHVLLGVGPSRYVDAFGAYETQEWIDWAGAANPVDSPHSWPLQALTTGGLPLLLIALALVVYVLHRGWRAVVEREHLWGVYAAVIAYGLALLVNFTAAGSTCLAAFLVGVLLSEPVGARRPALLRPAAMAASLAAIAFAATGALAEVALQRGVEASASGDLSDARDAFLEARRWRPYDSDIDMIAAQSLAALANGDVTSAARSAEAAALSSLEATPDTYASHVALSVALIAQDRLVEAETTLDRAIALFPSRPDAYVQRGIARFGQANVSGAKDDLRQAARLNPGDRTPRRILREINRRLDGR